MGVITTQASQAGCMALPPHGLSLKNLLSRRFPLPSPDSRIPQCYRKPSPKCWVYSTCLDQNGGLCSELGMHVNPEP